MFLKDGMKERYTSHQHTSIQITLTDIQGMICIPRRNEGPLHGMCTCSIRRDHTDIHGPKNEKEISILKPIFEFTQKF